MNLSDRKEVFLISAKKLYGDKYNYNDVVYTNNSTKVDIYCTLHSHTFKQSPKKHLLGEGCLLCQKEDYQKKQCEKFLSKAKGKHRDKYDYSLVNFKGAREKVSIICPVHGKQEQTPEDHLRTCGCFYCGKEKAGSARINNKGVDFLTKAFNTYGALYDYTRVAYKGYTTPVEISCEVHGTFEQTPAQHLKGVGCPKCVLYDNKSPTDYFIGKAREVHGDYYDYRNAFYTHSNDLVEIICPKHGSFKQQARNHSSLKAGCPRCVGNISEKEVRIYNYIRSSGFVVEKSNRTVISPFELDIIVPDRKVAIEYNGVRWHSDKFKKDNTYHLNKTKMCQEKGYRLIHIWEDDFIANPERELEFIKHALGCNDSEKVYARKTTIKEVDKKVAKQFLDEYHIQGSVGASVYLGAYYEDKLISVTAFTYKQNKSYVELVRHVNHRDYQVLGSLGKATKYFSKECKLDIISFCDLARFDGKSYLKAGFTIDKEIKPDYKYVVNNKREHKFNWRKEQIKKKLPEIYDESLTEKQMMELADIPRIWDCGKLRLLYKYTES